MIEIMILSMLVGAGAGFLAGLFGIGGGLVIVPALVVIFKRHAFAEDSIMLMALATSLASIILTSWFSARAHHRLNAVLWPYVFRLAPGIVLGTVLGTVFAERLASNTLKWIFCGFLLWVALQMTFKVKPKASSGTRARALDVFAGVAIGFMSALVGIGGGSLSVPYLVSGQVPMKNAVAVSSACGLPIALAGTAGYAFLGWHLAGLPAWSVGYVYLPAFLGIVTLSVVTAPLGAKLAHSLPTQKLKQYFSILLLFAGLKMIW